MHACAQVLVCALHVVHTRFTRMLAAGWRVRRAAVAAAVRDGVPLSLALRFVCRAVSEHACANVRAGVRTLRACLADRSGMHHSDC